MKPLPLTPDQAVVQRWCALGVQRQNALKLASLGIVDPPALAAWLQIDLVKYRSIGRKTLKAFRTVLEDHGLSFRDGWDSQVRYHNPFPPAEPARAG